MLDKKDHTVLSALQENSKLTTSKISKKTNIPVTTVHNRIQKLQREGIITKYTVEVDHKKLGKGMLAFVMVIVDYTKNTSQKDIAKQVRAHGAEDAWILTGDVDILAKIRVSDVDELNVFITEKLRTIKGVDRTETMVVLDTV